MQISFFQITDGLFYELRTTVKVWFAVCVVHRANRKGCTRSGTSSVPCLGLQESPSAQKHLQIKTNPQIFLKHVLDTIDLCDFKWFYLGCSNKPKGMDEGVTAETWRKLISTKELHTAQNLNMRETMEMTHPRQPGRWIPTIKRHP